MRKIIVGILLVTVFNSFSQELNYKATDSTMFELYTNAKWKELVNLGEKANLDYYYFNVRMGIAYFNLKQYYTAETYLKKAIQNNQTDFPKKYLFWCYQHMGESILAEQVYDQFTDITKEEIGDDKKFVESVYLEGGIKKPNTSQISNTFYGILSLKHRLTDNIRITHSLSTYAQSESDRELNSVQYNLSGNYFFDTSSIGVGAVYASSKFKESFMAQTPFGNQNITREVPSMTFGFYANYTRRFNRMALNINANYLTQTSKTQSNIGPMTPPGAPQQNVSESKNVFIPSVGLSYVPKIFKDRVTLATDLFVSLSDGNTDVIIKPYINISLTDKLWVNTSYLQIKEQLFSDYSTGILYNDENLSVKRSSSTLNYLLSPKTTVKLTYTAEKNDDSFQNTTYNTNSIFLGILYKF